MFHFFVIFAGTLHLRNDELRQLMAQLRVVETEGHNKSTALESAQQQLTQLSEQKSQSELHVQELQVGGEHTL